MRLALTYAIVLCVVTPIALVCGAIAGALIAGQWAITLIWGIE